MINYRFYYRPTVDYKIYIMLTPLMFIQGKMTDTMGFQHIQCLAAPRGTPSKNSSLLLPFPPPPQY